MGAARAQCARAVRAIRGTSSDHGALYDGSSQRATRPVCAAAIPDRRLRRSAGGGDGGADPRRETGGAGGGGLPPPGAGAQPGSGGGVGAGFNAALTRPALAAPLALVRADAVL